MRGEAVSECENLQQVALAEVLSHEGEAFIATICEVLQVFRAGQQLGVISMLSADIPYQPWTAPIPWWTQQLARTHSW
jgi:hypothetical protein